MYIFVGQFWVAHLRSFKQFQIPFVSLYIIHSCNPHLRDSHAFYGNPMEEDIKGGKKHRRRVQPWGLQEKWGVSGYMRAVSAKWEDSEDIRNLQPRVLGLEWQQEICQRSACRYN